MSPRDLASTVKTSTPKKNTSVKNTSAMGAADARGCRAAPCLPAQIDPSKVRVVEALRKRSAEVFSQDCYALGAEPDEMGDIIDVREETLWLLSLRWARSELDKDPTLQWEQTGITEDEISRIVIYTWPTGEPVQVFE